MTLRIIQMNLGHSQTNYYCFLSSLKSEVQPVDVVMLTEPYVIRIDEKFIMPDLPEAFRFFVPDSPLRPRVSIVCRKQLQACYVPSKERDILHVTINETTLSSVYFDSLVDPRVTTKKLGILPGTRIFCADVNATHPAWAKFLGSWESRRRGEIIYEEVTALNLTIVNNVEDLPSFVRGSSSSYIDMTASSRPEIIRNWKVLELDIPSDHRGIYFESGKQPWSARDSFSLCRSRNTRKTRIEDFVREVENRFSEDMDLSQIRQVLSEGINNNSPWKTESKLYRFAWWSPQLERLRKESARLRRQSCRTGCLVAKAKYFQTRTEFRKLIRSSKRSFFLDTVQNSPLVTLQRMTRRMRQMHQQPVQFDPLEVLEGVHGEEFVSEIDPDVPVLDEEEGEESVDGVVPDWEVFVEAIESLSGEAAAGYDGIQKRHYRAVEHIVGVRVFSS